MRRFYILFTAFFLITLGAFAALAADDAPEEQDQIKTEIEKGDNLLKSGKFKEAIKYFSELVEKYPQSPEAYYKKGLSHINLSELSLAEASFSKAIELQPDHVSSYVNRGTILAAGGAYSRAIKDYTKALEFDTSSKLALINRGTIYLRKGECENALNDFVAAIDTSPKDKAIYSRIAWVLASCSAENFPSPDRITEMALKAAEYDKEILLLTLLEEAFADSEKFKTALKGVTKAFDESGKEDKEKEISGYFTKKATQIKNTDKSPAPTKKEKPTEPFTETNLTAAKKKNEPTEPVKKVEPEEPAEPVKEVQPEVKQPEVEKAAEPIEPVIEKPEIAKTEDKPQPPKKKIIVSKITKKIVMPPPTNKKQEQKTVSNTLTKSQAPKDKPAKSQITKTKAPKKQHHKEKFKRDLLPYTIHVSSYKSPSRAIQSAKYFEKKGRLPITSFAIISGKGGWYRVYIDSYKTYADAKAAKTILQESGFSYAKAVRLPHALQVNKTEKIRKTLIQKGYYIYQSNGRYLIGAYESKKQAITAAKELANNNIKATPCMR